MRYDEQAPGTFSQRRSGDMEHMSRRSFIQCTATSFGLLVAARANERSVRFALSDNQLTAASRLALPRAMREAVRDGMRREAVPGISIALLQRAGIAAEAFGVRAR